MKQESRIDEQVFNLMDALRSPVLTFSTSWADCLPKRLLDIIPMARLKALIQHEELATYPEVTAYIMTATLEFPMHGEWVNIYTHVSCHVCEMWWGENHWEQVTDRRELSSDEERDLRMLRQWIYEKRRKTLKERMKSEKINPKTLIEVETMPKKEIPTLQQLQFEF